MDVANHVNDEDYERDQDQSADLHAQNLASGCFPVRLALGFLIHAPHSKPSPALPPGQARCYTDARFACPPIACPPRHPLPLVRSSVSEFSTSTFPWESCARTARRSGF